MHNILHSSYFIRMILTVIWLFLLLFVFVYGWSLLQRGATCNSEWLQEIAADFYLSQLSFTSYPIWATPRPFWRPASCAGTFSPHSLWASVLRYEERNTQDEEYTMPVSNDGGSRENQTWQYTHLGPGTVWTGKKKSERGEEKTSIVRPLTDRRFAIIQSGFPLNNSK